MMCAGRNWKRWSANLGSRKSFLQRYGGLTSLCMTVRSSLDFVWCQGNLSVSTMRLLKAVLPSACLWTSLRESEGFGYEQALEELRVLYPEEDMDGNEDADMGIE